MVLSRADLEVPMKMRFKLPFGSSGKGTPLASKATTLAPKPDELISPTTATITGGEQISTRTAFFPPLLTLVLKYAINGNLQ